MRPRFALPLAARNPISLIGIVIATAMAWVFLTLFVLDALGYLANPYIGLVLFIAVPAAFVFGLLLIVFGTWRAARRLRQAPGSVPEWPVLDLRVPRQRITVAVVVALTFVNVLIVSIAAVGSVHHMETTAFCGTTCHTTMEPQYVAHQVGPHASVTCVSCHVGPGAGALIQSKLAGTRQLIHLLMDRVPTPIPPPAALISPARNTCEQCHWSERVLGDRTRVIREYADDEKNSETATVLQLHVGGGSRARGIGTGIHWHMNLDNEIEFVTSGDTIPYVRLRDRSGRVREYIADGATPQQIAAGPRQRMDCMDCHSRPAHTFDATPARAIDNLMAEGRIPRELPFARRESVTAISVAYTDRAAALDGIASRLRAFYRERASVDQHSADRRLVDRAIAGAQDAWARNVFPAMKVTFGTYVSQLGHVDTSGCFRCHDDSHKTTDGRVISQDCELCHAMP